MFLPKLIVYETHNNAIADLTWGEIDKSAEDYLPRTTNTGDIPNRTFI